MKKSVVALLICVFIAGVFFGIWLDWSVWKKTAGVRKIAFELENYQTANLRVHTGDTIYLVAPPGGNANGAKMQFVGNSPCHGGMTATDTCLIDPVPAGGYFFNCDSTNGYACPDPGIQPSSTYPLDFSYAGTVKTDFVNFLGLSIDQEEKHEPVQAKAAHVAKSVDTVIVSCNAGATALNLRNGNSANPMPVSLGDSVFWVSPPTFTLSGLPAGFCTNGNPTGGDGSSPAECDIDPKYKGTSPVSYTVQQNQCGATAATLQF